MVCRMKALLEAMVTSITQQGLSSYFKPRTKYLAISTAINLRSTTGKEGDKIQLSLIRWYGTR
jgi:hypothetical protein